MKELLEATMKVPSGGSLQTEHAVFEGKYVDEDELKSLSRSLAKLGVYMISDPAYDDSGMFGFFLFDRPPSLDEFYDLFSEYLEDLEEDLEEEGGTLFAPVSDEERKQRFEKSLVPYHELKT